MDSSSTTFLIPQSLLVFLIISTISIMAAASFPSEISDKSEEKSIHIVYVNRPETEEAESFHIRTLASVLGSEEAAKEAIVYHYTQAASGFAARLTAEQAKQLEKKEEVLQVRPDQVLHLQSGKKKQSTGRIGTMHF